MAQKVESGTTVHGALDDLQPVDLSLDRPCAPGQRQGGMHSIAVLTQAPGKTVEAVGLRICSQTGRAGRCFPGCYFEVNRG